MSIYALNINVQSATQENNYRHTSLDLTPHDSIDIRYDSDFEVFPGTGTEEDPYVIEGYDITTTDDNGIYISGTTKYFIINNCYVDASEYGICIYNVTDGTATVINNTCSNNYRGIYLWDSDSSTIGNNTCSNNNKWGILLKSSGSSTVVNNTCSNNGYDGIWLYSSSSSTVANNTCSNNNGQGITFEDSAFCVVTYNLLQENEYYGIYLGYGSDNNLFHHNTFVDNYLGETSQAFDYGTNNFWYDTATLEGNYWSDWSGTGHYSINGPVNSVDLYPLDEPAEHTTTEHTTDENPLSFTFVLLMLVFPLILIRIISKEAKKE